MVNSTILTRSDSVCHDRAGIHHAAKACPAVEQRQFTRAHADHVPTSMCVAATILRSANAHCGRL